MRTKRTDYTTHRLPYKLSTEIEKLAEKEKRTKEGMTELLLIIAMKFYKSNLKY